MSTMKKITVMQARDHMADIINNVSCGGQRYKVTRHGKERAVIISLEEWERVERLLQEQEDEEDIRDAEEALKRIKKQGTIPHDEFWADLGHKTKCMKSNTTSTSKKQLKNSPKPTKKKSGKQSKNLPKIPDLEKHRYLKELGSNVYTD